MSAIPDMEPFLDKNISEMCGNGLDDPALNHCAHFVSHAVGLKFSYNCQQLVGGKREPANIRVHEVFAMCPRVGAWEDADTSKDQLIFVTRKNVVNVSSKTMQNIPQKHIGVYRGGHVYHYSNTEDRVIKQTVNAFYDRFQRAYKGDQGLFFGEVPGSELKLTVDMTALTVPHSHAFVLRQDGKRWFARRSDVSGEEEFFVGSEVNQPSKHFHGLYFQVSDYYGPAFDPETYLPLIDHWAYLLDVTGFCESKNRFNLINTYDRAHFTFGFYQLAAHTPRDNLILFFRAALAEAEFKELFPDLALRGGKVFRIESNGTETDLEQEFYDPASKEDQIRRFMTYLNPQRDKLDEQEILQAARLIWWANNSPRCMELQVKTANAILQKKMSDRYAHWYDLDGQSDIVCTIIADIHHQGRGSRTNVKQALAAPNKVDALLKVGEGKEPQRVATLRSRIDKWKSAGILGQKRYRAGLNEFA
jgi:hypothetical protein